MNKLIILAGLIVISMMIYVTQKSKANLVDIKALEYNEKLFTPKNQDPMAFEAATPEQFVLNCKSKKLHFKFNNVERDFTCQEFMERMGFLYPQKTIQQQRSQ